MNCLEGKHILIGVSGGIAAYKIPDLISRLNKVGADCRVVMSQHAEEFVGPITFQTLSKHRVYDSLFSPEEGMIPHIDLTRWADVFLIAPATANILGKIANGIADDLLSTTALAAHCPVIVAPAMNVKMYENPATQANMTRLKERGIQVLAPGQGLQACGEVGPGRMPEPQELLDVLDSFFNPRDLEGKKILITAGPTREAFDPVRFLTNRSSGRQGYALARRALKRGAQVYLVHGPVALDPLRGLAADVEVASTQEMLEALREPFAACDALVMAAAPCDYTPVVKAENKIKKDHSGKPWSVECKETPDILKNLTENKQGQLVIGFAAETQDLENYARQKLVDKRADYIVANDVSAQGAGFGGDTNIVRIFSQEDQWEYPIMSKDDVADRILDLIR